MQLDFLRILKRKIWLLAFSLRNVGKEEFEMTPIPLHIITAGKLRLLTGAIQSATGPRGTLERSQ